MRCPHCTASPSDVKQTTRPLDEGLEQGDIKRRLRKCRNCCRMFTTFEIHEEYFREIREVTEAAPRVNKSRAKKLKRHRLLAEGVRNSRRDTKSRITDLTRRGKND